MSTVTQLIAKGKAENAYNNSGISNDATWRSFFNDALKDLVDDLGIEKIGTISFTSGTREYDLPSDYHAMVKVLDGSDSNIRKRRHYEYGYGYFTMFRGSKHIIDLYDFASTQTFTIIYEAYPTELEANTETPDVPSVGESALIYFALGKALRNNNQIGMAQEIEQKYERERLKIRNAIARG